jgi:hypothetical protein
MSIHIVLTNDKNYEKYKHLMQSLVYNDNNKIQ